MKRPFSLVSYDPNWEVLFEEEKGALLTIFGEKVCCIHHIGSTAISSTFAKPEIDMLGVIQDDTLLPNFDPFLEKLGYRVRGECLDSGGTPGRFYYSKDQNNRRTHKLHICQKGHPDIMAKLLFVKYLNEHPQAAQAYAELKIQLSKKYNYGKQIEKYLQGKSDFILTTLEKANEKYKGIRYEYFCK